MSTYNRATNIPWGIRTEWINVDSLKVNKTLSTSETMETPSVIINEQEGDTVYTLETADSALVVTRTDADAQNLKITCAPEGVTMETTNVPPGETSTISTGVDTVVRITNATPSTSSTTGALTVAGGIGVAGDVHIAGDTTIEGALTSTGSTEGTSVVINNGGGTAEHTLTSDGAGTLAVEYNQSPTAQIFTITNTDEAVVLNATNAQGGNNNTIEFGGTTQVHIANTTSSTDKDTGALVVEGGVGIEENLNVGGDIFARSATLTNDGGPQLTLARDEITSASLQMVEDGTLLFDPNVWNKCMLTPIIPPIYDDGGVLEYGGLLSYRFDGTFAYMYLPAGGAPGEYCFFHGTLPWDANTDGVQNAKLLLNIVYKGADISTSFHATKYSISYKMIGTDANWTTVEKKVHTAVVAVNGIVVPVGVWPTSDISFSVVILDDISISQAYPNTSSNIIIRIERTDFGGGLDELRAVGIINAALIYPRKCIGLGYIPNSQALRSEDIGV